MINQWRLFLFAIWPILNALLVTWGLRLHKISMCDEFWTYIYSSFVCFLDLPQTHYQISFLYTLIKVNIINFKVRWYDDSIEHTKDLFVTEMIYKRSMRDWKRNPKGSLTSSDHDVYGQSYLNSLLNMIWVVLNTFM